jgi:hypothetical protein
MSFLNIRFPRLNKNPNLAENDSEISYESYIAKCKVVKTLYVSNDVYNCLGNELMEDTNHVLYEGIGGSSSDAPELQGKEFFEIMSNPSLSELFGDTCYKNVVEVVNTDNQEKFYVNTEGYKYARYVGRLA